MSEVANSVWTTAKRKLGFYGALAAFGGGVYLVYSALNPAVKYVEGPLGRKTHVQVSEPFIEGSNTTRYTVSGFLRTIENIRGFDELSDSRKTYIRRAIINYENGYTFANGDTLFQAVYMCFVYGIEITKIKWPLPEEK